jgi:hypothetical protein
MDNMSTARSTSTLASAPQSTSLSVSKASARSVASDGQKNKNKDKANEVEVLLQRPRDNMSLKAKLPTKFRITSWGDFRDWIGAVLTDMLPEEPRARFVVLPDVDLSSPFLLDDDDVRMTVVLKDPTQDAPRQQGGCCACFSPRKETRVIDGSKESMEKYKAQQRSFDKWVIRRAGGSPNLSVVPGTPHSTLSVPAERPSSSRSALSNVSRSSARSSTKKNVSFGQDTLLNASS